MCVPPSQRDWFDYASALTPTLIAIFVAFVAYRQWKVARQKLRLDLYNKRFAVFEVTLKLYQESFGETAPSESKYAELHRQFIKAMIEARFLFSGDSGIAELMESFNKSIFIIKGSRSMIKTQGIPPEERLKIYNQFLEEQMQLSNKIEQLERKMKPYLSFEQLAE